jgi:pilus assembly protein CpaF
MTTVHANTTRDALGRLINMAGLVNANFSPKFMAETVARALDLIVQLTRFPDGTRRVIGVAEITGMEGEVIAMQDIFEFRQRGVDKEGRAVGEYRATGIRPRCMDRILRAGYGTTATFQS